MTLDPNKALVLFSGGQDSTTCLAWALEYFISVETLGFRYGQRHEVELASREPIRSALSSIKTDWGDRLGADHILDLPILGAMSETALTRNVEITTSEEGLPTTFVPGRNIIFLAFAAAFACRIGAKHIVLGVCETDFSGYPDCRDDSIKAMQVAVNLGIDQNFVFHTPIMWMDKARTWELAEQLGGLALIEAIKKLTHSCYLGDRGRQFDWGRGCGACPACELRRTGYAKYAAKRFPSRTQSY